MLMKKTGILSYIILASWQIRRFRRHQTSTDCPQSPWISRVWARSLCLTPVLMEASTVCLQNLRETTLLPFTARPQHHLQVLPQTTGIKRDCRLVKRQPSCEEPDYCFYTWRSFQDQVSFSAGWIKPGNG